jgi:glycosyltransferase involved in cell wall biosynthesis
VIFFGLFTPLQGAPVIGAALGELAHGAADDIDDIEVTMVGSGQELAETRRLAAGNDRVTWRDWVPADELPALVADHDVCLGIFGSAAKATRVVPNKVYQGAAAGCALVTSDTAPQRRVLGDAAVLVPPGDSRALAAALRDLAADRDRLAALRAAARALADERFTPDAVVRPLDARLRSLVPPEVHR